MLLIISSIQHAMESPGPGITIASDYHVDGPIPEWQKKLQEELIIAPLLGKPEAYKNPLEYTYLRAAFGRNFEKVFDCVNRGVNINVQSPKVKYSALHCALWLGKINYPLLFFLLSQDAIEVNLKTDGKDGQTPFNFACAHLLHSYQNSEKDNCYQLFLRLIQKEAIITQDDLNKIYWNDLKKKGCEHPELEQLIKSRLTTKPSAAALNLQQSK